MRNSNGKWHDPAWLIAQHNLGLTHAEMAGIAGCSRQTITKQFRALGIGRQRAPQPEPVLVPEPEQDELLPLTVTSCKGCPLAYRARREWWVNTAPGRG